jgi:UDP-glucose 4-epimerase
MEKSDLSSIKDKKILLVGGTGFIGRQILVRLLALGADVTIMALFRPEEYNDLLLNGCKLLKGDVTQPGNSKFISETNWNIVINVGGFINHGQDEKSNEETFTGHLLHVRELVALLPKTIERYVHAGSALEYGNNPAPHSEDMRERPLIPYAAAKVAATHYLQMLYHSTGFPSVILRPFYIYGPGQDKARFLPWAIEQSMLGRDIKMTKGEQTRDPISVTEVAEAFIRASIEESAIGEVINIASGKPVTIAEVANMILNTVGQGNFKLGALPYRHGEIMRSEADVSKCRDILGMPSNIITINDGIKELVQGYSIGKEILPKG